MKNVAVVGYINPDRNSVYSLQDSFKKYNINFDIIFISDSDFYKNMDMSLLSANTIVTKTKEQFLNVFKTKRYDGVIFLNFRCLYIRNAVQYCIKENIKTYGVQVGIMLEPYPKAMPNLHTNFTFGKYWSEVYRKNNSHVKHVAVGSLKSDVIIKYKKKYKIKQVTIIGQDRVGKVNSNWQNQYPAYYNSIVKFYAESKNDENIKTINNFLQYKKFIVWYRPHAPYITNNKIEYNVSFAWETLANSQFIITGYSTLGLECAGAGLPCISYFPKQGMQVINFEDFGLPVIFDLNDIDKALEFKCNKDKINHYMEDATEQLTGDKIALYILKGE